MLFVEVQFSPTYFKSQNVYANESAVVVTQA